MAFMQRHHGLRPGETVLHKTTLTFDDSALELFWALIEGGRIWLIAPTSTATRAPSSTRRRAAGPSTSRWCRACSR